MLNINYDRDIVLFNYYSTRVFLEGCFINISNDLAHRNLFLFKLSDGKIHFEFPVFENHTYNSICNLKGVRSLIKRDTNEKYIIFRTQDQNTKKRYIIGYYKIGKTYYQETKIFNNNGFVCGFEASEIHLLKRREIIFKDNSIGIGHNVSWHLEKWNRKLNNFLNRIQSKDEDYSDLYQKETLELVHLFKDEKKMDEWKDFCKTCIKNKQCYFYRYNERYKKKNPKSNMYDLIHKVYNSNIYSKNILDEIPKKYIR